MSDSYVLVSDDSSNKVIVDGPLLWDGVTVFAHPLGTNLVLTVDALAEGYTWPVVVEAPQDILNQHLVDAITANDTFLALSSPSSDDIAAQVIALTRQVNALARLSTNTLDSTDDS